MGMGASPAATSAAVAAASRDAGRDGAAAPEWLNPLMKAELSDFQGTRHARSRLKETVVSSGLGGGGALCCRRGGAFGGCFSLLGCGVDRLAVYTAAGMEWLSCIHGVLSTYLLVL